MREVRTGVCERGGLECVREVGMSVVNIYTNGLMELEVIRTQFHHSNESPQF